MAQRILVWDLPTRIFHWLLVASFFGAFLTGDSERWQDLHVLFGYTVLGLFAFRLVWGVIGTRYVRFVTLMRSYPYIVDYLVQLLKGRAWRSVGHNPVGSAVILLLLIVGVVTGMSGWAVYEDIGGDWMEALHDYISNVMLAMIFMHIAGVLVVSYLQKENLVIAMITGRKRREEPNLAISNNHTIIAILLLTAIITCWCWLWPDSRDMSWFHMMGERLEGCINHML